MFSITDYLNLCAFQSGEKIVLTLSAENINPVTPIERNKSTAYRISLKISQLEKQITPPLCIIETYPRPNLYPGSMQENLLKMVM